MQFYNVVCCYPWYLPHFYPKYEFKINVSAFLIVDPRPKIGLDPQGHNN